MPYSVRFRIWGDTGVRVFVVASDLGFAVIRALSLKVYWLRGLGASILGRLLGLRGSESWGFSKIGDPNIVP